MLRAEGLGRNSPARLEADLALVRSRASSAASNHPYYFRCSCESRVHIPSCVEWDHRYGRPDTASRNFSEAHAGRGMCHARVYKTDLHALESYIWSDSGLSSCRVRVTGARDGLHFETGTEIDVV